MPETHRRRAAPATGATAGNVRALRPMCVLLVTDDDRFAEAVVSAAARQGLAIARARSDDDLDQTCRRHRPNVVALDADGALARAARTATAFATLNPRVSVVLVCHGRGAQPAPGITLVRKRTPPDRLLDAFERAHLGLTG